MPKDRLPAGISLTSVRIIEPIVVGQVDGENMKYPRPEVSGLAAAFKRFPLNHLTGYVCGSISDEDGSVCLVPADT